VLGFIETLQGPARNDAAARDRFLAIMREQGLRMARLVDDLLSLSRIELRAHLAPETPVDLAGIAREILDSLVLMAREREVALKLDVPPQPVTVAGDRDELLRLMENLVENAIKYGQRGGEVDIAVAISGDEASISVRDDGPGIAPEHLPRLTERFYRVDTAASREAGGTGLGLAIVKHIVLRHRGRLTIESTVGQGATFRAILPRLPESRT
jgi:two-component system, OmpR family, phosphate regulon sensor histidine kinase PhoR